MTYFLPAARIKQPSGNAAGGVLLVFCLLPPVKLYDSIELGSGTPFRPTALF